MAAISRRTILMALDAYDFSTHAKIDEFIVWFELEGANAVRDIGGLDPRVTALKLYLAGNLNLKSSSGSNLHEEIIEHLLEAERQRLARSYSTRDDQPSDRFPELVTALARDGFGVDGAKLTRVSASAAVLSDPATKLSEPLEKSEDWRSLDVGTDYLKRGAAPAMNAVLGDYAVAQQAVQDAKTKADSVRQQIHDGLVDRVMVFIDMVGSTEFKVVHADAPEVWLWRVHTFCDMIRAFVEDAHGTVVKYIGDEVMAVFDRGSQISDAMNLVSRVRSMEDALTQATGEETKIKIALDYGKVMLLKFDGHAECDPQGTPVDRCARISKFAVSGTVVSSEEFVNKCPNELKPSWQRVGSANLKGLGETAVYQLGTATVEVYDTTTVKTVEYEELRSQVDTFKDRAEQAEAVARELQEQLAKLGERPVIEAPLDESREAEWAEIMEQIDELKDIIDKLGGASGQYAEALFLHRKGLGLDNSIDSGSEIHSSLIKRELVYRAEDGSSIFFLDPRKAKNPDAIKLMDWIEDLLQAFVSNHGVTPDDDFEYSLSDVDFWAKYLGYNVE